MAPVPHRTGGELSRIESLASAFLLGVATCGLIAHCLYVAVGIVDDAGISIAFARSLAEGHGFRLTPASEIVEGFSNPLWTLWLTLAFPLQIDPLEFARISGIVFGVASLPVLAFWGPVAERRSLQLQDIAGPALVASVPSFAYWCAAGLETGLHALLLAITGLLLLRAMNERKGLGVGITLALLCLTRPEAPVYVAAVGLLWTARLAVERRGPGRAELVAAACILGTVAAVTVFRWIYFAAPLPNTYYAKSDWDFRPFRYFVSFTFQYRTLWAGAVAGVLLSVLVRGAVGWRAFVAVAFSGAAIAFMWSARGDWMTEWRFLAPVVPSLAAGFSAGLSALRQLPSLTTSSDPTFRRMVHASAAVALVVAVTGQVRNGAERAPRVRLRPTVGVKYISTVARHVGKCADALRLVHPRIALPDLGGTGLTLRHAEIVDPARLADYALARAGQSVARIEDYLLNDGLPAIVDVHGPSGYLHYLERVGPLYGAMGEPCTPWKDYSLRVLRGLTATADPRCPESKAAVLGLTSNALAERVKRDLERGDALMALRVWQCAYTYKSDDKLPSKSWRVSTAAHAEAMALTLTERSRAEQKLRYLAFAQALDPHPHRRRIVEAQRALVFPDRATSQTLKAVLPNR